MNKQKLMTRYKIQNMKYILVVLFLVYGIAIVAQEVKKPEYVIVANNEIINQQKLESLMQEGLVKSMNKGVSQDVFEELVKEHGNKIGEKEFVIIVELFSKKEKKPEVTTHAVTENKDDGLILQVGDRAADFTVEMIDGTKITLSELKGKVVLLNFWATWCGPCLMEFYEMPDKIIEPFGKSDFVFIPVSRGENKEKVVAKMQQFKTKGISFNVGIDPEKKIWNEYAKHSIPKNFVIDKEGVIRYISTGNSEGSVDKIAEEIKKLLSE